MDQTVKHMFELVEHRNRTIEDVVDIIAKESNKETDQIYKKCNQFYDVAKKTDIILLKGENVPNFSKGYKRSLFGLGFI